MERLMESAIPSPPAFVVWNALKSCSLLSGLSALGRKFGDVFR
jgi:hypothetical protein